MQDFRRLSVLGKSHLLTMRVYQVTRLFPKDELYGLTSQLRRASSSIPANIAEGCGREGASELGRFLQIAQGSASELEYHLLLSSDLKLLKKTDYDDLSNMVNEVRRMLTAFIQKLKTKN
jgi:four helix bundle protein